MRKSEISMLISQTHTSAAPQCHRPRERALGSFTSKRRRGAITILSIGGDGVISDWGMRWRGRRWWWMWWWWWCTWWWRGGWMLFLLWRWEQLRWRRRTGCLKRKRKYYVIITTIIATSSASCIIITSSHHTHTHTQQTINAIYIMCDYVNLFMTKNIYMCT